MFRLWNLLRQELLLIACFALILLGIIYADSIIELPGIFAIPRSILGMIYVLFVPGYLLQLIAFPIKQDLDIYERVAVAFGLSLAMISALAIGMDYSPLSINSSVIIWAETISVALLLLLAWWRQSGLRAENRFSIYEALISPSAQPEKKFSLRERGFFLILIIAGLVVFLSLLFNFILQGSSAYYSEFYLLGENQIAADYPRTAVVNEVTVITIGIRNKESEAEHYFIEVRQGGQLIGELASPEILPNESWESPLSFTPLVALEDAKIEFFLYRETDRTSPYLNLYLWLTVLES